MSGRLQSLLPRSLRMRLLLSHLVVMLAGVGLVAGFAGSVLADARLAQAEHGLEDAGFILSNDLEEPLGEFMDGEAGREAVLAYLAGYPATRGDLELAVITVDGRVLTADPGAARAARGTPEVEAAFRGGDVTDIRRDASGREMIYTAVPIVHEDEIFGVLRLGAPMAPVREAIARTLLALGGVVLLVALLAGALAWWLAEGLVRPLRRLTLAAGHVAEGRWDRPVPAGSVVELASLAVAFNEMARRLRNTLANQRAFVANASHELRTPLTSVKLRVEALRDWAGQDPEVAPQFLAEIEGEVDRLARLADDLLDLSRVEANHGQHAREPVDLALLAEEARASFSVRAGRAGVALSVERDDGPLEAAGDEEQLRRLLTNLVDNAIKFTPAGGRVTLRLARTKLGAAPAVKLEVADTGLGIAPEHLPHVFERFYRGEPQRAAGQRRGSGLGLSLAGSIVAAHGGTITAESAPDQGTTMRVVLVACR
jgi:signal transduction histidine kinase